MLGFVLRGCLSVCFFVLGLACFSQTALSNTLLWRISGNGLSKPSYLYGTMHLQDKRLFQFGDSLYNALEKTEGLAIEVDFKEAIDSVFRNGIQTAEEEAYLRKSKVKINRSKLGKTADSLLRSMGVKGNIVTKKELKEIRNKRMANVLKQGEMPTIMDAYLLGLAMRHGKWTGGIEDVADQLNLSDELGGALKPENVLVDERLFKTSLEEMIALYLSQNITKLEQLSNTGYTEQDKDTMLVNRNIKMAYRMDSLSHVRTMFFAVGAAHLAGDSGVIRLLLAKGFQVNPVFSSSTVSADIYAEKLKEIDWLDVVGEDSVYTVKMPGTPSDFEMFGEAFKMKMFFDVTTMTFYMAGSVIGPKAAQGLLDTIAKNMIENMAGKNASAKIRKIDANGIEGREIVTNNSDCSYKVRVLVKGKTVFMLLAGGLKQASIQGADAEKFFQSFKPGDSATKPVGWTIFNFPEKAFSISMPGKPSLNKPDETPDSDWTTVAYSSIDASKGMYYMVQIGDTKEGTYLDGDSVYFEQIQNEYRRSMDTGMIGEISTYLGFPALTVRLYYKEADANYKIFHVLRGNRKYMLLAGAQKDIDLSTADPFFNSFELLPYPEMPTNLYAMDGFSTNAPAQFVQTPADSSRSPLFYHANYYVTNKVDAVSYEVFKRTFSNTYWTETDSAYFESKITEYKTDDDTLLRKSWVQNGTIKGVDVEIGIQGSHNIKKVRMLVNKDTLYTLFAMIPPQYINEKRHQQFFNDFRLSNEVAPTIYSRKVPQLLQALLSTDSVQFEDAFENLDLVSFEKGDISLLREALMKNYRNSKEYDAVNGKLVDIITDLADSSTQHFTQQEYSSLSGDKEHLKYFLLELLAKQKTAEAYELLKKLLLQQPPKAGFATRMEYALYDSTQLTAALFPELLSLANDSLVGYSVIRVASHLLDSSSLSTQQLRTYAPIVLNGARNAWRSFKKEAEPDTYEMGEWAIILGWLNTADANALLRQMLTDKHPDLKRNIILALLKNSLTAPPAEVAKVAADKLQRSYFYDELKKLNKQHLFPAIYATQKSLAESDLQAYFYEELDKFTLTYIGERTEMYKGRKRLFHLFKLRTAYDDENIMQNFLAVAGPYEPGTKDKTAFAELSGFYSDEEWTSSKSARLLKAYLEQMKAVEE